MSRGVTSVVGVVLLVALTVLAAAALGAALSPDAGMAPPTTRLSLAVDPGTDRIELTHEGGATLQAESLRVRVRVDGDPLVHQPPVPFFAATGFAGGPTGPFNSASDGAWRAGETAAVELAGTNSPTIAEGSRVTVTVATDRGVVTERTTTAG